VYDSATRKIVKVRTVRFKDNSFEEAKRIHGLDQFVVDNELEEELERAPTTPNDYDVDDDDFIDENNNNNSIDIPPEKKCDHEDVPKPIEETAIENDPPPTTRAMKEARQESKQQSMEKPVKGYSGETVPVIIGKKAWEIEHKTKVDQRNIISGSRRRKQRNDSEPMINSEALDKMPELDEKVRVNWDPTKYTVVDDDGDAANVADDNGGVPLTFEEATSGPDAQKWWASMRDEMASQNATNSFRLVKRTKGMNVLPTKWVYRDKRDENGNITKKKSRLVPKGFRQRYGIDYDETFATSNSEGDENTTRRCPHCIPQG
jgi:hypothetical protein